MANYVNNIMHAVRQAMRAVGVNNNNLANANTIGFKEEHVDFQKVLTNPPGGAEVTNAEKMYYDTNQGQLQITDRSLDVALKGSGFLTIQAKSGEEVYSRSGSLQISSDRFLVDTAGNYVLGDQGPISIPAAKRIEISENGIVSILPDDPSKHQMEEIARLRLVNPSAQQLSKGEDGYFRLPDGEYASEDPAVKLVPGALEGSNVDPVESMVNLIQLSRDFEQYINMIRTQNENDQQAQQILKNE